MIKIQVLGVVHREGTKNGNAWSMNIASCSFVDATGNVNVGELVIPKNHPVVVPGAYTVTVELSSYQGKLESRIKTLTAAGAVTAPIKAVS